VLTLLQIGSMRWPQDQRHDVIVDYSAAAGEQAPVESREAPVRTTFARIVRVRSLRPPALEIPPGIPYEPTMPSPNRNRGSAVSYGTSLLLLITAFMDDGRSNGSRPRA
jgi:hypothetical protein